MIELLEFPLQLPEYGQMQRSSWATLADESMVVQSLLQMSQCSCSLWAQPMASLIFATVLDERRDSG